MHSGSRYFPMRPYQSVARALSRTATCVEINHCVGWRGTGIATPSSRRRVDGVEVDETIQRERAVKFDFHTGNYMPDIRA